MSTSTSERAELEIVASPVVKAGGSSNGEAFAMSAPAAARGGYSSTPGEDAVTITGSRSGAEMVGSFPFGEDEWVADVEHEPSPLAIHLDR